MKRTRPSYQSTAFGSAAGGFLASLATALTSTNPHVQVVGAVGLVLVPLAFIACNAWLKRGA